MDETRSDRPLPFLFVDCETTGHDPLERVGDHLVIRHEIIDIGAVLAVQPSLDERGTFSQKVRPERPKLCDPDIVNDYPKRAARGEWDDAVSLLTGLELLLTWCRELAPHGVVVPTGQNVSFDWSFLSVAFAWNGISEEVWRRYFHYGRLDTRSMAVQELWAPGTPYEPDRFSLRNPALADRLNLDPEPYPRVALNGARKSYEVFKRLREIKESGHA